MAFKFRLQRMLSLLEKEEGMKRVELANERSKLRSLENRKSKLNDEILYMLHRRTGEEGEWDSYRASKIALNKESILRVTKEIQDQNEVIDQKMADLLQISRKLKAMESLRNKKRSEYRYAENLREQKSLEELFRLNKGNT